MASKKKLVTSAIALGLAGALTLGGTFAWQSISQTALNESSDVVNPGGRLHNDLYYTDLNTTDSNVYVENFTDSENGGEDIFARVRLEEYMEVVLNHGTKAEQTRVIIGERNAKTNDDGSEVQDENGKTQYDHTYKLFKFDEHVNTDGTVSAGAGENTESRFTWTMGGQETAEYIYMPTFNKNKDSLAADLNGLYKERVGGISKRSEDQYEEYTHWTDGEEHTASAIYDIDSNMIDELEGLDVTELNAAIESGNLGAGYETNAKLKSETHEAKAVGTTKGLISMEKWLALNDGTYTVETHGNYWVYDTDGWVYWSSPIKAGTATGLLLDSFTLSQVMDNTWYYAINVVGQFCTADDSGWDDMTGFYADGESITDNAKTLLEKIGVAVSAKDGDSSTGGGQDTETPESPDEDDENTPKTYKLNISRNTDDNGLSVLAMASIKNGDSVKLWRTDTNAAPTSSELRIGRVGKALYDDDYTYDEDTGLLTMDLAEICPTGGVVTVGWSNASGSTAALICVNDDGVIDLKDDYNDGAVYKLGAPVKVNLNGAAITQDDLAKVKLVYASIYDMNSGSEELPSSDYTFADGALTISNEKYKDSTVVMTYTGDDSESYTGVFFLLDKVTLTQGTATETAE